MLRSAWIFLAAILLPSLVLAWLAVRSARDQQVLLEHQQAIISQDITDAVAGNVRNQIDGVRSEFVQITQDLLTKSASPRDLAVDFDHTLRDQWQPAEVGFAVDLHGNIFSPGTDGGPAAQTFREENDRFLSNRENAEVYSSLKSQNLVARDLTPPAPLPGAAPPAASAPSGGSPVESKLASAGQEKAAPTTALYRNALESGTVSSTVTMNGAAPVSSDSIQTEVTPPPAAENQFTAAAPPAAPTASPETTPSPSMTNDTSATASLHGLGGNASDLTQNGATQNETQKIQQMFRNVLPQQNVRTDTPAVSNSVPEESDFRRLIGADTSGALARFLDNKLQLLVWYHPSAQSDFVFGAQLNQGRLLERLRSVLPATAPPPSYGSPVFRGATPAYCLALLDDDGRPVALSIPGFTGDWKHPFVATEIGEALPHWEAALYLTDPQQMMKSARTLKLTLGLIVVLLVVAIVAGGSLIAADMRRQLHLARQKTDFVSNVSHELKTPLTSIRMFADLLAEGRVSEPARQSAYLKIISAESARLTRLINNVLDFARQERGAPAGEHRPGDLVEITRDVVETCRPHLEAAGQNLACEIEAGSLPILGDRDALSQVVLNLVSNAEKYGGGEILVRVRRQDTPSGALGCVDVLDRGPGVPPKQVESIFLPFHRLDDSLSSGIPGSGLGLTLARRMARAHGGDITYTSRAGGGSCFTLAVPLTPLST